MLPFTLQQIRILITVATHKSLTKSASILNRSQPYISKQIKTLENNLNTTLITKNSNQLILTKNGQVFLEYSNKILSLCEESCRALKDLEYGNRGILNVGTSQTIGTYIMPRILVLFKKNYPYIDLNIQINSTKMILQRVAQQQIDLAIIGDKIPNSINQILKFDLFIRDDLNLIVSKVHPFAKKGIIKREDLYRLKFITLNPKSAIDQFVGNILKQKNIEIKQLKTIMQLNSIEAIKTAVSLNFGVAFIYSSAIEKEIELKTIEIIKIENIRITNFISMVSSYKSYKSKPFVLFYNQLFSLKMKKLSVL